MDKIKQFRERERQREREIERERERESRKRSRKNCRHIDAARIFFRYKS